MADEKLNDRSPEPRHSPDKAADPKPIAEDLSDSELEEVSGGLLTEPKNNICGSNC